MQVNDVIQVIDYCSLSIVMQVNDAIQVIKTIVRYLLLCKLMMLYKLSRLLFVIYCYAS